MNCRLGVVGSCVSPRQCALVPAVSVQAAGRLQGAGFGLDEVVQACPSFCFPGSVAAAVVACSFRPD